MAEVLEPRDNDGCVRDTAAEGAWELSVHAFFPRQPGRFTKTLATQEPVRLSQKLPSSLDVLLFIA